VEEALVIQSDFDCGNERLLCRNVFWTM